MYFYISLITHIRWCHVATNVMNKNNSTVNPYHSVCWLVSKVEKCTKGTREVDDAWCVIMHMYCINSRAHNIYIRVVIFYYMVKLLVTIWSMSYSSRLTITIVKLQLGKIWVISVNIWQNTTKHEPNAYILWSILYNTYNIHIYSYAIKRDCPCIVPTNFDRLDFIAIITYFNFASWILVVCT